MVRGHVDTTDHDGNPLKLLFMMSSEDDQKSLLETLNAHVEVLRTFVTKWNQGEKDINGKDPVTESQPCSVLVVMMHEHVSTRTPDERKHITVTPASSQQWAKQPHETKGLVHVYSLEDKVQNGYEGHWIHGFGLNKWRSQGTQIAIAEAEANEYKQST